MIVNTQDKQAVKAAIALLIRRGQTPAGAACIVQDAQEELMLLVGDLHSLPAKEKYAIGVYSLAEKASNRKWGNTYTPAVQQLAQSIANWTVA